MFRNGVKACLKIDEKSIINQSLLQIAAGEIVMTDDAKQMLISYQDPNTGIDSYHIMKISFTNLQLG
jgi:hypothetical protein